VEAVSTVKEVFIWMLQKRELGLRGGRGGST